MTRIRRALRIFRALRDGWASVCAGDGDPVRSGGSGGYGLRAFGEDEAGQARQWMLEEVLGPRPAPPADRI